MRIKALHNFNGSVIVILGIFPSSTNWVMTLLELIQGHQLTHSADFSTFYGYRGDSKYCCLLLFKLTFILKNPHFHCSWTAKPYVTFVHTLKYLYACNYYNKTSIHSYFSILLYEKHNIAFVHFVFCLFFSMYLALV